MPPLPRLDPPKKKYPRSTGYGRNPTGAALVKKQDIKRVAARLFAERGVAAVGLASVGMVAQLPNRGVSYYYRNREDLLGDILIDHVLCLTQRVGAAHDATEAASPVARLHALVLAFHETVLAARDAHRAMLFNIGLLPPRWQSAVLGRYRLLLDTFVEPVLAAVPDLPLEHARAALLPLLERLLSGPVFWVEPVPTPPIDADALGRHARLLTQLLLSAARAIATDPPVVTEHAAEEDPTWLAPLRPDAAPNATWNNFSAARTDAALDAAPQPTGAKDAAATQARLGAGLAAFERVSAREALHRWYEVLPVAASGVTFVITSRGYPLAQLGPLTREAAGSGAGAASPVLAGPARS
jgi:AcrR family transcriptional regulator/antitoxin (DNA-binding transcriptional repressor) of toxin-antitoxin stability system